MFGLAITRPELVKFGPVDFHPSLDAKEHDRCGCLDRVSNGPSAGELSWWPTLPNPMIGANMATPYLVTKHRNRKAS